MTTNNNIISLDLSAAKTAAIKNGLNNIELHDYALEQFAIERGYGDEDAEARVEQGVEAYNARLKTRSNFNWQLRQYKIDQMHSEYYIWAYHKDLGVAVKSSVYGAKGVYGSDIEFTNPNTGKTFKKNMSTAKYQVAREFQKAFDKLAANPERAKKTKTSDGRSTLYDRYLKDMDVTRKLTQDEISGVEGERLMFPFQRHFTMPRSFAMGVKRHGKNLNSPFPCLTFAIRRHQHEFSGYGRDVNEKIQKLEFAGDDIEPMTRGEVEIAILNGEFDHQLPYSFDNHTTHFDNRGSETHINECFDRRNANGTKESFMLTDEEVQIGTIIYEELQSEGTHPEAIEYLKDETNPTLELSEFEMAKIINATQSDLYTAKRKRSVVSQVPQIREANGMAYTENQYRQAYEIEGGRSAHTLKYSMRDICELFEIDEDTYNSLLNEDFSSHE